MAEVSTGMDAASAAARGEKGKEVYVREIFSEIAPRYDLLNHLLSLNIDRRWRRAALRELGWNRRPEGTYLDLCAGTLDVSLMLASQAGFNGSVVGADFAEPMLRAGIHKLGDASVDPVAADALKLPLRESSVDGAIVAFGIRNVASLSAGLSEVLRVLRPGARFVILEFSTPRSPLMRILYLFYFNRVLPLLGRIISGHKTAYKYLPESVANFPMEEELASRLDEAGFGSTQWRSLFFGVAAIHTGIRS